MKEVTLSKQIFNLTTDFAKENIKEKQDRDRFYNDSDYKQLLEKKAKLFSKTVGDLLYESKYKDLHINWFIIAENLWPKVCIDEVNLCWDVYTIISNPESWKIIAFIPWIKASVVTGKVSEAIDLKTRIAIVKEVSIDMSNAMNWIWSHLFPWTIRTYDRFHVTKNVLDDNQAIRIRTKTKIKDEENNKEDQFKLDWMKYYPAKFPNWETRVDFITRLRYQLYKRRKDWNECQKLRYAVIENSTNEDLLQIKIWYEIVERFYEIYDDKKKTPEEAKKKFKELINTKIANNSSIIEIKNIWKMLERHLQWIVNYFHSGHNNWFAEWLHSRIKRILSNSKWFRNKDYMVYRIMKNFA